MPNSTLQNQILCSDDSASYDDDSASDSTSIGSWTSASTYEHPQDEITDLRMQILALKDELTELKSRRVPVSPSSVDALDPLHPDHPEQLLSHEAGPSEQLLSREVEPSERREGNAFPAVEEPMPCPSSIKLEAASKRTAEASRVRSTSRIAERKEMMSDVLKAPIPHHSSPAGFILLLLTYVLAICFAFSCPEPFSESKKHNSVDASKDALTNGFVKRFSESKLANQSKADNWAYCSALASMYGCVDAFASAAARSSLDEFSESKQAVSADASVRALLFGPAHQFSQSKGNISADASKHALMEESLHGVSCNDVQGIGHSLLDAGDDNEGAEEHTNPHMPPENPGSNPWSMTAGSLTLTVALRWLQGFHSSPSTTLRHW